MPNKITKSLDLKAARDRLDELKKTADNFDPALLAAGRKLLTLIQFGFRNSASPYGEPWSPLKVRQGKPLQDTNRLRQSINMQLGGDGEGRYLEIGTNLTQAKIQHYGGTIKPIKGKFLRFKGSKGFIFAKEVFIPARPYMPIRNGDIDLPESWEKAVLDVMTQQLERAAE